MLHKRGSRPSISPRTRPTTLVEGRASAEHLVQHHAQREEVRPRIERIAPHLLGRRIARQAHRLRTIGRAEPREPKDRKEHPASAADEDVLRAHVAMKNWHRSIIDPITMRVVQRLGDVDADEDRQARRQRARGQATVKLAQVHPIDELGDGIIDAGGLPKVEDRHDASMAEVRRGLHLRGRELT